MRNLIILELISSNFDRFKWGNQLKIKCWSDSENNVINKSWSDSFIKSDNLPIL